MTSDPARRDDKIRFTPGHEQDLEWDDAGGLPYVFHSDFEAGWADSYLESFFD